jgi:hypothetical protein
MPSSKPASGGGRFSRTWARGPLAPPRGPPYSLQPTKDTSLCSTKLWSQSGAAQYIPLAILRIKYTTRRLSGSARKAPRGPADLLLVVARLLPVEHRHVPVPRRGPAWSVRHRSGVQPGYPTRLPPSPHFRTEVATSLETCFWSRNSRSSPSCAGQLTFSTTIQPP